MTGLSSTSFVQERFDKAVNGKAERKRPSPVSMRFPEHVEAELRQKANGQSLGTYVRDYVINGHGLEVKTRNRSPIKDHVALARVLSALGRSGLYETLSEIYRLASEGKALTSDETISDIRQVRDDIAVMRQDLIAALNVREGNCT